MSEVLTAPPETQPDLSSDSAMPAYRADFDALHSNSRASEPAWLGLRRASAMRSFEAAGFPTMRDEDWHFTNVAPIASRNFHLAVTAGDVTRAEVVTFTFGHTDWHTFVFVDGRFRTDLSTEALPEGVTVDSLAGLLGSGDHVLLERHLGRIATPESSAFTALNTAFAADGAVVRV
ncbi:MAG: hypothetical protein H0U13_06600, partial [Gemmatimonadaceae bacterium]|nr:hypothetical protein [Gemmatimonadaceae bacterium]